MDTDLDRALHVTRGAYGEAMEMAGLLRDKRDEVHGHAETLIRDLLLPDVEQADLEERRATD